MVLEVALIDVVPGREDDFAAAYGKAREILAGTEGCRSVRMTRGIESPSRFVLLVEWDSVDAHDRVVFASTGGTPGYRVGYGTLVAGGTGDPIPLAGKASLVVVFTPASAPGYDTRQVINPGLPTVKQIKFGEDFEGYVSAG